ncbi:MAG: hypothetical protein KY464_04805 [Gemmatimonadetes bacterium]|nr:hypothetical protein [Gemmatimonadota bacterium]
MMWFPMVLAAIAGVAGVRYLVRLRYLREEDGPPSIDDDAIRQIVEKGTLKGRDALNLDEIARAEDDFWAESWDEPEEHLR